MAWCAWLWIEQWRFGPWLGTLRCVLGWFTIRLSHCFSPLGCIKLKWVLANLMLWVTQQWTSIPSKILFSNSLIIPQVKTKEITTVTVVWIPSRLISIGFDDFTSLFTPYFLFRLRRYVHIKHSRQCFIGYPNTSNFVKNTPLRILFSTLLSVFGYPDETLSLVFDILHSPFMLR